MRYYPVNLDLQGRAALVVGGGESAARKLRLLLKTPAAVTLVAPEATDEIRDLAAAGRIRWEARAFRESDLEGVALVHIASEDADADHKVAALARARGIPTNLVDAPEASSFIVPAIVDRDPLVISISSGGTAPVLARRVRERIESLLPARLGQLAAFAERFRGAVAATLPASRRRAFWEKVIDGPVGRAVLAGESGKAQAAMLGLLNRGDTAASEPGVVHIVGAGPGDPDLLTLKALRLIQDADVILYDALVGEEILELARRDAERRYVGKRRGAHSLSQEEINALIAEQALSGKRVVRLKGGDPFVFGRGGEELLYLRERGIAAEVVPGITAAAACAASAGIPLTHRNLARAVTLVTGHAADGEPDLDWAALADPRQTVAVYMGVNTAGIVSARLIEAGAEASRPVAVIEKGSRADQKVVLGTLASLEDSIRDAAIKGPALLIIGEVVALAAESVAEQAETASNENIADALLRAAV